MNLYAKSNPIKTIKQHTEELLEAYNELKKNGFLRKDKIEKYDYLVERIIFYHDLGKINHKFQNKLKIHKDNIFIPQLKDFEEIPHEWLSIAFISNEDKKYFKSLNSDGVLFSALVQYCIAFHHSRTKPFSENSIKAFIRYDFDRNKNKFLLKDLFGINYPLQDDYNIEKDFERKIFAPDNFKNYFPHLVFLKGILHKCDYAASAEIQPELKYKGDYHQDFGKWVSDQPWKLRDYQVEAKKYSGKSIVLVASTGMGKTECAMNWINGGKAFYLLGIRIAVNEMFNRFRNVFGDNVSLLHGETSFLLANEESDSEKYDDKLSKVRQFSFPLTVATADQLVTSVFKYNGFELVYFTASYSKIVVDEIQSFAPSAIAAIVVFLKEIHKIGGRFMLMTATLPPFVKDEFKDIPDIVFPEPQYLDVKRHKIKNENKTIDSDCSVDFIKKKSREKKVLIICNTVKKTQKMFDLLSDLKPNLIHSRFIVKDRRKKETDIMNAEKETVWISTQIVEASLDIDFDILFTECATVESLFQRFGRCYRKREYREEEPNIYIFQSKPDRIYDNELFTKTWESLIKHDKKLISEEEKQLMIEEIFSDIKSTKYYQKYLNEKMLLELDYRVRSKREAQDEFRLITNSHIVIPEPVYKDNNGEIEGVIEFIDNKDNDKILRLKKQAELRDYTISLQIFGEGKKLLKEVFGSDYCKRHSIRILQGVSYCFSRGLEFIDGYKNHDNFIE